MAVFGNIFAVPFSVAATTNPYDLVGILAPSNSQVCLRSVCLGMISTGASVNAAVRVDIFRGSTISSTGTAVTPIQLLPSTSPAPLVAASSVTSPSSVLVSTASATLIHSDSWCFAYENWYYNPGDSGHEMLARADVSQRLHIRMGAMPAAITVVGTAYFSEVGKGGGAY